LATLIILIFVFNKVAKIDIQDVPYPVYALAGMMPWTYFAFTMNQSGSSIINAAEMVKKIYFPRLVIPLSKAVVGFIDFIAVFIILVAFMIYYQYLPPSQIIYLPVFLLLTALSAVGIGILVSALTIRYRDFQHIVPFAVQIGFYATPIAYPSSIVPEKYQLLFHLNPMAGVVEGFRWCLVGGPEPHKFAYISFLLVIILFVWSLFYFKKIERIMADIV
jgi:lipopolysaccharide transport system permease protein